MNYTDSIEFDTMSDELKSQVRKILDADEFVIIRRTLDKSAAYGGRFGEFDFIACMNDSGDINDMYYIETFKSEAEWEAAYYA